MASWSKVMADAPELAARVQRVFDAHRHKTMATLRSDGSPRISGTEAQFRDGELWIGSMPEAHKARDLRRDPRIALHSATVDPDMADGDAKVAGRAVEITDDATLEGMRSDEQPPGPYHLFRIDVTEMVLMTVAGDPPDHMVIESWHEGRGVQRVERR
ncbi:MAG TPA: pyridoxamine 5'-phosphate oxidase family protein [Acidimicrobiia bacterium]